MNGPTLITALWRQTNCLGTRLEVRRWLALCDLALSWGEIALEAGGSAVAHAAGPLRYFSALEMAQRA